MRSMHVLLLMVFAGYGFCLNAAAQTLWMEARSEGDARHETVKAVFHDGEPNKIRKHDLVTVIIRDVIKTTDRMQHRTDRENTLELDLQAELKTAGNALLFRPRTTADEDDLEMTMESKRENKAKGNATRNVTSEARITAEVKDVLPNGNLVLEGMKETVQGEEIHRVTFSGIARQEDVRADNTIVSERIANVKVRFEPEGPLSNAQRRGWATRVLDFLWPF